MLPSVLKLLRECDPETRYQYEERAGIIEYCANVPRAIAEYEAARDVFGYYPAEGPQRDDL